MPDIESRIRKLRLNQNMTLSQFGQTIGYSKTYISLVENGKRPASAAMADRIIKEYCVNREWLMNGVGEIYDRENAGFKETYKKLLTIIRRYPQDCESFRMFLLPNKWEEKNAEEMGYSVLDRFPGLTLQKFYRSDEEPKALMQALTTLYANIESALTAWIKSVRIIKNPEMGFAELYKEDKAEINEIEHELLELQRLFTNNCAVIEGNTDNNVLLGIGEYFLTFHRCLDYMDNIEVIEFMKGKMNKPQP